jgi:hypothetical protein
VSAVHAASSFGEWLRDHLPLVLVDDVAGPIFGQHRDCMSAVLGDRREHVHSPNALNRRVLEPCDPRSATTVVALRPTTVEPRRVRQVLLKPSQFTLHLIAHVLRNLHVVAKAVGQVEQPGPHSRVAVASGLYEADKAHRNSHRQYRHVLPHRRPLMVVAAARRAATG